MKEKKVCSECDEPHYAKGFCKKHYHQDRYRTFGPSARDYRPCSFEGCERAVKSYDLCQAHASQRRKGQALRPIAKRQPGGSPYLSRDGYVIVRRPGHPMAQKDGRISEHRLVMSEMLGRALFPGEEVHHKNGDRADNRPENLELWVVSQPAGQRPQDLVAWAKEILERYEN